MPDVDLSPLKTRLDEFAPEGRTALLPALHAAQELYGYLPETAASEIARALNVPLADVYGVIEFYALLSREPVGRTAIHVCDDPACAIAGADKLLARLIHEANQSQDELDVGAGVTIERAPCLGLCEHA